MKKIALYLKLQYKFIILLILFINTPYFLNFKLEFNIPYLLYFFLIFLFSLKIFVIKSNASSKKILNIARASFKNSTPSKQETINRGIDIQNGYDFCLVTSGLLILFTYIFNQ